MEIVIHLGLHRTGSTALQGALARARRRLAPHGVGYPALPEHRPVVAHALGAAEWTGPRGLAARLIARRRIRDWARAREAEGVSRLVLSDETLAGDLDPCLTGRGPYPFAARRLALLAEALRPWPCRAVVALREPGAWLASARAFAVSRRPQPDFGPARAAALDPEGRGWADLAAEIHAAFPNPVFWDAGLYETRPRRVHKLLVGRGAAREVRGARRQAERARVNPSLPAAALAALEAAHAAGETVDAARRAEIAAGAAAPGFAPARWDPWTAEERARLAARYRDDLAAIRAMGLTVLGAKRPPKAGEPGEPGAGGGRRKGAGRKRGRGRDKNNRIRGAKGRAAGPAAAPHVIGTSAPGARQGGPT
ncbi:MAG: hypothetical protein VYD87_04180 [Pseudomonadota bacterium]|nr:hypothetical protein [Pseudomonadota bacterium]